MSLIRIACLFFLLTIAPGMMLPCVCSADESTVRPNIVWIIVDDMSANLSCYGETTVSTPHVDALAARGTRFTNAVVTAPVCSTCRSAFITGMYQTSIGAHHHRSGRGTKKITLPKEVRPIPELFQEAGYYTSVSGWPVPQQGKKRRLGKTDYNFEWSDSMYNGADWSGRSEDQPFFAQIQLPGGKLRGASLEKYDSFQTRVEKAFGNRISPDQVTLPPYYPRDIVLLRDWAAYLDSVRETDRVVGEIVQRLREEEVLDNTVVLFMTDHGISHARGKQFLYEDGIHIPLVIAGPGIDHSTRRDPVEHIDIAALSLGLAGISIPSVMQARDILAKDYQPRDAVFSARDRCDETVDHLRSVRTERYKYIRNFLPQRPHLQPCGYKDAKVILQALRTAHAAGTLNEDQSRIFNPTRPPEELYDLQADPHELHNLADVPEMSAILAQLRGRLDRWMTETGDLGRTPEDPAMYDSDMKVYLDTLKKRRPDRVDVIQANIDQMKRWASEGK